MLKYPIIWFSQDLVDIGQSEDNITICTKAALHSDFFKRLLLVDSEGNALKVCNAKKICGVGPFWGYNIFLNQRIKVELITEGEPFFVSVDEVKKYIFKSFQNWHGWASRGDFDELKESVAKAQTITELIQLIAS